MHICEKEKNQIFIDMDSLTRLPTFAFNLTAYSRKSSEKSNAHPRSPALVWLIFLAARGF